MNKRPGIFLDRDGTINREVHYLSDPEKFELLPGVADAIAEWNAGGWVVVVVTNQSGVGRGYFTGATLDAIHEKMRAALSTKHARVDAIYFCTHLPEEDCACRKPRVELFHRAAEELDVDFRQSFFIGDKWSDVAPASELGGRGILLRTGHGEAQLREVPPDARPVIIADDLRDAFHITTGARACQVIEREN
jgi:D-glycero-D-manno-heptose 1,7-bisphosphate phosphatase